MNNITKSFNYTHLLLAILFTVFSWFSFFQTTYAADASILELPYTGSNHPIQPKTIKTSGAQPKVTGSVKSDIEELPRTGVPAIMWGLAAIAPVGYSLRNKFKGNKKNSGESAHSVWIKRELQK